MSLRCRRNEHPASDLRVAGMNIIHSPENDIRSSATNPRTLPTYLMHLAVPHPQGMGCLCAKGVRASAAGVPGAQRRGNLPLRERPAPASCRCCAYRGHA